MGALIYCLTDMLHLLKIFACCDLLFMFNKRKESKARYIISLVSMLGLSIWLYVRNVTFIAFAIYIMVLCVVMYLIYDEKIHTLLFSELWILFLSTMLDIMTTALINVFFEIINQDNARVEEFIAAILSLFFIVVIGKKYKQKYNFAMTKIGLNRVLTFTILAVADAFAVIMITTVLLNEYTGSHTLLYSISIIIAIIGIFIQLASVILLIISRDTYKEKEQITQKYLNEQIKHYKYLEQREKDTKKFRHDIKNHMQVLSVLAKDDKYSEFDEYMKEINIRIDDFGNHITMNNGIVDAILNRYYSEALKKNIDITISGIFPNECHVSPYDLCTIFSNVLSNAIEAAEKADEKKIIIKCRYTENSIVIVVKNTFKDEGQFLQSKMMTTKKNIEYHGFGI